jgi:hypothetical protein
MAMRKFQEIWANTDVAGPKNESIVPESDMLEMEITIDIPEQEVPSKEVDPTQDIPETHSSNRPVAQENPPPPRHRFPDFRDSK